MNVIQWIVSERILEHIRVPIEKPLKVSAFRGHLVAGVGETSNFDLVRDLKEVVDYLEYY